MNLKETFEKFCDNLKVKNTEDISKKYRGITKKLNQKYYESNSDINNCLQVGSYGRKTGIHGISDLDMLFELPKLIYDKFNKYETNGPSALLQEVKNILDKKYSTSDSFGDGQVVVIKFNSIRVEVLPVFLINEEYYHPNSNNGGSWERTNPKIEIKVMKEMNEDTKNKFRHLSRMVRAWKNNVGVNISGYLIDTLVYNFFKNNKDYEGKSFQWYDFLIRDFFKYLSELNKDQEYWLVPGSKNKVYKKENFTKKSKKAYHEILEAITKNENITVNQIWKKVFGNLFPVQDINKSNILYDNTEEFIEDLYVVDISASLKIDCKVKQDGFREGFLRTMKILKKNKNLEFFIEKNTTKNYDKILWKVKNVGNEAEKRNNIRGQIVNGKENKNENTNFKGKHFVECYIIKNNICIARDRIDVPISI